MGKVLFTSHLANFVKFNRPFIAWFHQQGWEVHYASRNEETIDCCDKVFDVCFHRSPYSTDNIRAYFQLKGIINREQYDIIHCHTPMGGVVTRLAAKAARKCGTKVIYTAHGFHFYRGAPRKNWLIYYPVEKYLSRYTDCLITINQEDYNIACEKRFRADKIEKIDGVGVDLTRFFPVDDEEKRRLRASYGYSDKDFILLCVAEFIPRKNHRFLLQVFRCVYDSMPSVLLLLAGRGELLDEYTALAQELSIIDRVRFLGYRNDIKELCNISDILVSASKQEGLPINIIEGMASGLPVVCTCVRGHTDVIGDGQNGYLYDVDNTEQFTCAVRHIYDDAELRAKMSKTNCKDVRRYSQEKAVEHMAERYRQYM